ncbi:hypothetical protein VTI74DRAFT_8241 [Chaetomium olivicolor]
MPPFSPPNDESLLERLNALKPSGVALGKPTNNTSVPGLGIDTQGASREDALAARLRLLRSQQSYRRREEGVSQGADDPRPPGRLDDDGAGTATPPPGEPPTVGDRSFKAEVVSQPSPVRPAPSSSAYHKPPPSLVSQGGAAAAGALDEDALDELLELLGEEDFDIVDDIDFRPSPGLDTHSHAKKVADHLEPLKKHSGSSAPNQDTALSEDDDDSDGDQMARAVETILSQIGDEISALSPSAAPPLEGDILRSLKQQSPSRDTESENSADGDSEPDRGDEPVLSLPAVPSKLVDPIPDPKDQDKFEQDISSRMASLRGLGSLDALGMPSAPAFRPQDHAASDLLGKGLLRSSKYTDEDQKTWCVVCLEDAAIRCVGCDNDVYCARCWKEMHVGPSAGYDERGHQWVKFERNRQP